MGIPTTAWQGHRIENKHSKSIAFLYIKNTWIEKEFGVSVPFTTATKTFKYFRINLSIVERFLQ